VSEVSLNDAVKHDIVAENWAKN